MNRLTENLIAIAQKVNCGERLLLFFSPSKSACELIGWLSTEIITLNTPVLLARTEEGKSMMKEQHHAY